MKACYPEYLDIFQKNDESAKLNPTTNYDKGNYNKKRQAYP